MIGRALRQFFSFWYGFVVGDDPAIALGVVVALGVTALLSRGDIGSWWLLPVVTGIVLTASLVREVRVARRKRPRRGRSGRRLDRSEANVDGQAGR
jgi:hypothetical protein